MAKYFATHGHTCGGNFPDWDDTLSGRGIEHMFQFVINNDPSCKVSEAVKQAVERSPDPPAEISTRALQGDEVCLQTMDLFYEMLGQDASYLALRGRCALGGVYVCGGVVQKTLPLARRGALMRAFDHTKAPAHVMRDLLSQVPVYLVTNCDVALLGAAHAVLDYPADVF
eukprot:TRINITY_DN5675_c0_g1_i1.p2 TRINITY_DN5675_c0_g1~~TRINITY_DN5675_c0_g1_i1.p2  ORF type:complete len:170 (-),score=45.88 TRINITY_DN5675_c0_g1_i1:51-560(-)